MARHVRTLVLAGNGINCEMETAHACRLAGADQVDIGYIWDLMTGKVDLLGYQLLCLPGGFLDGDDLGSARALAIRIQHTKVSGDPLFEKIKGYIDTGGLIIGICNGFQLMVKLGLLPAIGGAFGVQQVTLTWNDSGRYEDRWVQLAADPKSACVFTRGVETIQLPVRHGEGKIVAPEDTVLTSLIEAHQVPLRYIDPETGDPTATYPQNPNGSPHAIAALSDATGRLFGMMPHPEAYWDRTNHPRWTRQELPEQGAGLAFFQNAVEFIRQGG